jgi:hypothetical protein
MLIVGLLISRERHELQTQFPPSRIELWNASQFRLPSLHSVLIKAGARNPIARIATTINGHSATAQKEMFQSEFSGVGFLFMYSSQAFEDRHFTNVNCFPTSPPRRFFQNGNENAQGRCCSAPCAWPCAQSIWSRKLPRCTRRGFF